MRSSDVADGIDLAGRRVVVTGASSGLGVETARMLAAIGAEATIAVRNTEADRQVEAVIAAAAGTTASASPTSTWPSARPWPASQMNRTGSWTSSSTTPEGHPPDYRPCADVRACGQSKTANVTFAGNATDRWALDDITVNAAMPGPAHTTSQRRMDPERLRSRLGGKQLGEDEVPPRDGRRPREPGRMLTPAR